MLNKIFSFVPVKLSILAAILYSSWPLGYWLDPVVARGALASELGGFHRPYNWLFIATDCLTGLVLLAVGFGQLKKAPAGFSPLAVYSYMIFGFLVALAALTPLACNPTSQTCGPLVHNYRALVHGFASIASVSFLLIGLLGVMRTVLKSGTRHFIRYSLLALLAAWLAFAAASLAEIIMHIHGNILQYFFITVCSLSIVAIITAIELQHQPPKPA